MRTLTWMFLHLGLAMTAAWLAPARAQTAATSTSPRVPFTEELSNIAPLAFGMDVTETSRALGQPLQFVSGRPGQEIYLAFRNTGGSGLINHHHRLFLQFRNGKLAGWKGDWGHNWMWQ
jgi:hypothetical protein